ncbi:hypothetical protein [Pararhodobacter sp. SW119]|uniref:hypothetical protein n=1 Tax=Pararhodobacter sp. SW119 TaxID=2780075 RepID=UPI001AE03980|nr:hypothetical protein [Pararhodobacter sp. SW119]
MTLEEITAVRTYAATKSELEETYGNLKEAAKARSIVDAYDYLISTHTVKRA